MKIGILTFHFVANYGAYLQAYSLTKAIEQLGHQVEIIDYRNPVHYRSTRFHPWVYRRPLRLWFNLRKHQAFNRVVDKIPLSSPTADPAQVNWNAYDAIVVGSDIVWNCEFSGTGLDKVFFGQFPIPYRGRLVAYAPSIGDMKPDYPTKPWVAEGLRRFHSIGVRDTATQQFVRHHTGREVPIVADPTWLDNHDATDLHALPGYISKDFLLVYSFLLEGAMAQKTQDFARQHHLPAVAVGYYQRWADRNLGNLDPFEWSQLFRQAKYVVCGTFHGTLYCIKQQARFCLLSHPAIDPKVMVPLTVTGLRDRLISDANSIEKMLKQPIDYKSVEQKRTDYVRQSLAYLKQALS